MQYINGAKTYVLLAVGMLILVLNHFGISIPGITIDDNAFMQYAWGILVAAAANHGIHKGIAK